MSLLAALGAAIFGDACCLIALSSTIASVRLILVVHRIMLIEVGVLASVVPVIIGVVILLAISIVALPAVCLVICSFEIRILI